MSELPAIADIEWASANGRKVPLSDIEAERDPLSPFCQGPLGYHHCEYIITEHDDVDTTCGYKDFHDRLAT
jgi:hypothetical protein